MGTRRSQSSCVMKSHTAKHLSGMRMVAESPPRFIGMGFARDPPPNGIPLGNQNSEFITNATRCTAFAQFGTRMENNASWQASLKTKKRGMQKVGLKTDSKHSTTIGKMTKSMEFAPNGMRAAKKLRKSDSTMVNLSKTC
jgi:hypothetical protein